MQLIIDGKTAVLKKGSSFDYVSENRAFSDADAYTLSITLPLAGCPENINIFGHIDRKDVDSRHIVLEASLFDRGFSKNGIVTVVEATDIEVKCQFLEGRSVQNFNTTFDDIYINEMNLGSYPESTLPESILYGSIDHGYESVPLPWWNESSNVMNNEVLVTENNTYKWADSTVAAGKLSYMPYLISLTKRICQKLHYTFDSWEWDISDERFLLVCNVLPAVWDIPQFARALPHWSVSEFFSELEKILVCEFDIDHKAKHISIRFSKNVSNVENEVLIENVLDTFTSEVSYEDDLCRFKGCANIGYADRGDQKWGLEQCQWLVDIMKTEGKYYKEFQTEADFTAWRQSQFGLLGIPPFTDKDSERGQNVGYLMYIAETNRYGMWRVSGGFSEYRNLYTYEWLDINRFGDIIYNPASDNSIELKMVPAYIQSTDEKHGDCLFMSPSSFSESEDTDDDGVRQPIAYSNFLKGEPDSKAEYYDKIFLAYWKPGLSQSWLYPDTALPPCPVVDQRFSLANRYNSYLSGKKINPKEKFKASWIAESIPDVRATFHIGGKRYVCEKITATFTENGMSQLLKGEFYPLLDQSEPS